MYLVFGSVARPMMTIDLLSIVKYLSLSLECDIVHSSLHLANWGGARVEATVELSLYYLWSAPQYLLDMGEPLVTNMVRSEECILRKPSETILAKKKSHKKNIR